MSELAREGKKKANRVKLTLNKDQLRNVVLNLTKKKNLSDTPPMYLRFSTKPSYKSAGKLRQVCADTGATVAVIPEHIAQAEGLAIEPIDFDEPELDAYGGNSVTIVGQTKCYIFLDDDHKHPKLMNSLVVKGSDEVLISWQLLMRWGVISPTFPKIMNPNKLYRIKHGVTMEDAFIQEGDAIIESVRGLEEDKLRTKSKQGMFEFMKSHLITKYPDIIKEDLEEGDTIKTKTPSK